MTTGELAKLTPEKKRIRIAELCGKQWRSIPSAGSGFTWNENFPDYLNDLNAMHEAEKVVAPTVDEREFCSGRWTDYSENLCKVVGYDQHERVWFSWAVYHATALQRADAFLLTLG